MEATERIEIETLFRFEKIKGGQRVSAENDSGARTGN